MVQPPRAKVPARNHEQSGRGAQRTEGTRIALDATYALMACVRVFVCRQSCGQRSLHPKPKPGASSRMRTTISGTRDQDEKTLRVSEKNLARQVCVCG